MPGSESEGGPADAYRHCAELVRDEERDRFYATLFAPAEARPHLHALYAFAHETARIRDAIRNPLAGEIRLQWWRDALSGGAHGDVAAHPVAAALLGTIGRFDLPRQGFLDLLSAREFDLYDDPMPSLNDLEGYLGETSSATIRLASLILAGGRDPGAGEAAGHAGVAYGMSGLLRALPRHAARGQLYLPRDLLDRHGVTRDDVVSGRGGPGLRGALNEFRGIARRHLADMRRLRASVAPAIRPAFLPVALVPGYLGATERRGYDPYRSAVDLSPLRKLATIWLAARRGP